MEHELFLAGHSTCYDGKTCATPCDDLTTGANCELCRPGYWGNPINGGTCQKCECNGTMNKNIKIPFISLTLALTLRYE